MKDGIFREKEHFVVYVQGVRKCSEDTYPEARSASYDYTGITL